MPPNSLKNISASKHRLGSILIVLWLSAQIIVPFLRKFPDLHYHYATFSWAMYSKPALIYEVSLYRTDVSGKRGPIPDIRNFVNRLRSPEPVKVRDYYRTETEIQRRYAQLVAQIARKSGDDHIYHVSIHWIHSIQLKPDTHWEFAASGKSQ